MMTHRERFMAVLEGRHPDHIPWVPRLELWYDAHKKNNTLPAKYRGWTLEDIYRDLGMGHPARGGRVHTTRLKDVEVVRHRKGYETLTEYITPVGTVSTLSRTSEELLDQDMTREGREIEFMIKRVEDYPVVEYIIEHTEIVPIYAEFLAYEKEIGEEGVPFGHLGHTPMEQFLRALVGWNRAYYELYDHPTQVEHLVGVLTEWYKKLQKVAVESPARLILHGLHFHSQMTPPPIFRKYLLPYMKECADYFHSHGKLLMFHGDADTNFLLDLILEAGYDVADCFVTAPMVQVTLDEARRVWGTDIVIWGGIPSILVTEAVSEEEFEAYMDYLFKTIAPGDAIILGVADNVMPEAIFERIVRISELVRERGKYPIAP